MTNRKKQHPPAFLSPRRLAVHRRPQPLPDPKPPAWPLREKVALLVSFISIVFAALATFIALDQAQTMRRQLHIADRNAITRDTLQEIYSFCVALGTANGSEASQLPGSALHDAAAKAIRSTISLRFWVPQTERGAVIDTFSQLQKYVLISTNGTPLQKASIPEACLKTYEVLGTSLIKPE